MSALRILTLIALLTAAPAAALADLDTNTKPPAGIQPTTTTLAEVLAKNAAAIGKAPESFASRIEEWSFREGGMDAASRTVWKGRDFKSIETRGPISTQFGRIAGVRWEQTENGITIVMGDVHTEAADFDEAMSSARAGHPGDEVKLLGEVSTPVSAYVVEVHPAGDPPTWLFFDKSSGQLVRRESAFSGIRTTATFSDFSSFSGAVVPTVVHESDGELADDRLETLKTLRFNAPVSGSDLNVPPTRGGLVQFPAGVSSVKLPAHFPLPGSAPRIIGPDFTLPPDAFRRHVTIRVTINGRGLDFVLDSGASGILIDKDVAEQLGLVRYGIYGQTLQGRSDTSRVIVPEMHIGDLTMKNVVAFSRSFYHQSETEKAVGLLGFDFIASVGLKLDWDRGEATAYPPGQMPTPTVGITLPIRLDDRVPTTSVSVGDAYSEHFILDTGASEVTVFPAFAAAHPDVLRDQGMGRRIQLIIPELYLGVVGGVAKAYPVQVRRFVFGVAFDEFLVLVVDPESEFQFQDTDGLIGYQFLHYFNLYFDYPNSRILLEPNGDYQKAKKVPTR